MKIQIFITHHFLVNCATASNGEIGFCHCNTCSENEGDCDSQDECQDGLVCGSNNCPTSLGFGLDIDCCWYCFDLDSSCGSWANLCSHPSMMDYMTENCKTTCNLCGSDSRKNEMSKESLAVHDGKTSKFLSTLKFDAKLYKSLQDQKSYPKMKNMSPPKKSHGMEHLMFKDKFTLRNIQQDEKIFSIGSNHLKNERGLSKIDALARMEIEDFYLDQERKEMLMEYYPYHRNFIPQNKRKLKSQKMFKSPKKSISPASTRPNSQTKLKHSHQASSKYGLTVILNPKEAEYTNALKNNFIGFKTLVHTPYNFPVVDAVGMAMDKNIQATVGIRGHHSFITEAANELGLYQKKCLSRSDNVKQYKDIKLDVFAYYTKKGCLLECHANIFNDKCGCLPYYYPDFSSVWNKTTNCNHTALQCISKLVGKQILYKSLNVAIGSSKNHILSPWEHTLLGPHSPRLLRIFLH